MKPCFKTQTEMGKIVLSPLTELVQKWVGNLVGIQKNLVQVLRKPLLVSQYVTSQAATCARNEIAKDREF